MFFDQKNVMISKLPLVHCFDTLLILLIINCIILILKLDKFITIVLYVQKLHIIYQIEAKMITLLFLPFACIFNTLLFLFISKNL